MSVEAQNPSATVVLNKKKATTSLKRQTVVADDYEDILDSDDARSVDSDDAGSIADFIVDDEDDDASGDDDVSVVSDGPQTKEEERSRDLDGVDTKNILSGKRTRRPTNFYEQAVFNTDEYRRMMLEDVPDDELKALESSEEESEVEDEEDDDYDYHTTEDENEDGHESDGNVDSHGEGGKMNHSKRPRE